MEPSRTAAPWPHVQGAGRRPRLRLSRPRSLVRVRARAPKVAIVAKDRSRLARSRFHRPAKGLGVAGAVGAVVDQFFKKSTRQPPLSPAQIIAQPRGRPQCSHYSRAAESLLLP